MSAYTILLIIALSLSIASLICNVWVEKKWVCTTACVLFVLCIIAVLICFAACFGRLMNKDTVIERGTWRQMVERGEIEVYDDLGHITRDAAQYNIDIAKIQDSVSRYGRWSVWYGIGAEELEPITKEDQNDD